jgi:phosphoribosylglycinamide formyltransferase 1
MTPLRLGGAFAWSAFVARKRVGVLISGRGSNLQALIEAAKATSFPAEIVLVVSNVPGVQGLARAEQAGIPPLVLNHKDFASRDAFDAALDETLRQGGIELLCNAGFMRLHSEGFVRSWWDRHLNIHPSLLPAFRGLHTHARVLDEGAKITGCTVHFVRPEMDTGPIVAQAAVPVLPGDTPDDLAARVLEAEHQLYPHALSLVASGAVRVEGEAVVGGSPEARQSALFSPPLPGAL